MPRAALVLAGLLVVAPAALAATPARAPLRDLYFGEALYHAHLGGYFDAIARLDTELGQHYGLDERERDSLHYHIGAAEFAVGDFELYYRMHLRAGRAIKAVLEGAVDDETRNEAAFRLARIHFQKHQPVEALQALERIRGRVPERIRAEARLLRAQVLMAGGNFAEAAKVLGELQNAKGLEAFAAYNLGIALWRADRHAEGGASLDRAGRIGGGAPATAALRDKANLVLGSALLEADQPEAARRYLERVRLSGPYSTRALLAAGWADAARGRFERALAPWTLLSERDVTDDAVQEGLLALPHAYAGLNAHGRAARLYEKALGAYGNELAKLAASIASIREGKFLQALTREELKQDANWVMKLRNLPQAPETYYLMELMASHNFQTSLKNYLDLEELRHKLAAWDERFDAYAELIETRRAYYQPLLPDVDKSFRALDSQMRLRLEQRQRLAARINAMLTAPRPDLLATPEERQVRARLGEIERQARGRPPPERAQILERVARLRGFMHFSAYTEYDRRLTEAYRHLQQLDALVGALKVRHDSFVRTRQAARQSYEGYEALGQLLGRARAARARVEALLARQGHMLEVMAIDELERRARRLEEHQTKARFALADSYDRAVKAQAAERVD